MSGVFLRPPSAVFNRTAKAIARAAMILSGKTVPIDGEADNLTRRIVDFYARHPFFYNRFFRNRICKVCRNLDAVWRFAHPEGLFAAGVREYRRQTPKVRLRKLGGAWVADFAPNFGPRVVLAKPTVREVCEAMRRPAWGA